MRVIDHLLHSDDGKPVPFVATPHMGGPLKPTYLVIHASASLGVEERVRFLASPEGGASVHLLIGRDGRVTQLVPFDRAARHVPESISWVSQGPRGLDHAAIGIELENAGRLKLDRDGRVTAPDGYTFSEAEVLVARHRHEKEPSPWHRYTDAQVAAAREAASALVAAYGLFDVRGHDDLAPGHEFDPGPAFPMKEFRAAVLGEPRLRRADAAGTGAAATAAQSTAEGTGESRDPGPVRHLVVVASTDVRSTPEAFGAPLPGSPLPAGTAVEELERKGEWARVSVPGTVNDVSDITGWVNARYLAESLPEGLEEALATVDSDADTGEAATKNRPARKRTPAREVKAANVRQAEEQEEDELTDPHPASPPAGVTAAQLAEAYGLAGSAEWIVARAAAYASSSTPPAPLNTIFLLVSLAGAGRESGAPEWTADWLRGHLGPAFDALRKDYFERKKVRDPEAETARTARVEPSDGLASVLASAREIAERTTGAEVYVRHLAAALLLDPRGPRGSGALFRLGYAGAELPALRESLFAFVAGGGDDDHAWGTLLLGEVSEAQRASGYDADATGGRDYLGIERDVRAFAALIAARTLTPPLSIGLFGEWGSGKTFFMRRLRDEVARLAREAREQPAMQCDLPFYKRIVQIEFNAWHYSEGNLWASLVQHIFENLRLLDDRRKPASEELQEPLLRKLRVEKAAEARAARERDEAEAQRRAAERNLHAARLRFERKAKALARVSGENFLADVPVGDVRQAVDPALNALGIAPLADDARQLHAAVVDARAQLTRASAVLAPLFRRDADARGREWTNLLLTLLAGPLLAALAGGVLWALGAEGIASVGALAAGAAGVLERGTRWLKRNTGTVRGWLDQVEAAHRQLEARIAAAQAENAARVREAEEWLRLREADYAAARRREEEARTRVAEAEARLREASVTRLLSSFIEERANSSDYRRHLGVLALVRNDFERLSDLIEEENWRLAPPADGDEAALWTSEKFRDLAHEAEEEATRINRIVLYIDDLDRCPPPKVVEVLQAVHLLLAFPLFVVVVGVDARWVTRSLEARHRETLKRADPAAGRDDDEFRAIFGTATSHDYLEKIFQVPFWLRPMNDHSTRTMVSGLLRPSMLPAGGAVVPAEPLPPTPADADAADEGHAPAYERDPADAAPADGEARTETPDARPADGDLAASEAAAAAAEQAADAENGDVPGEESLTISEAELAFIQELAPLLGRSPRALKRFVNVYRLIRVRLSRYQRDVFMREDGELPEYRAVLLLLAIDTGAPLVARELFAELQQGAEEPVRPQRTVAELIASLDADRHLTARPEWERVSRWLRVRGERLGPGAVARLARSVPRVARFSFHTGRVQPEAPAPADDRFFRVKAKGATLREAPQARGARLGELAAGTVVRELEEVRGWRRVAVADAAGGPVALTGWVSARSLERVVRVPGVAAPPAPAPA